LKRIKSVVAGLAVAAGLITLAPAAGPASAIVNGHDALNNAGVVSIWTDVPYRNRCGGSIVQADKIITAAHCYYALTAPGAGRVDVRIGGKDNTKPCATEAAPPPGTDCYISRTIVDYDAHPGFDGVHTANDLMVAVLDRPVPSWVKLMQWQAPPLTMGGLFRVQGWGWVCDNPPGLDCSTWYKGPLQEMNAKAVDFWTNCPLADDPATQVCFMDSQDGFTLACSGDSGTGGFTKSFDRFVLRVVVTADGDDSTGRSCVTAPDGSPGAGYGIDIGRYQAWLTDVLFEDVAAPSPPATTSQAMLELAG
jgi:trypsin